MPFHADRVAAVRADGQATGCLLTPRLVLTVSHVRDAFATSAAPGIEAAVLGGTGWTPCTVVWQNRLLDAALLLAERDLVAAPPGPLRWGAVESLEPVPGCHVTGFPAAERDAEGRLDTAQVLATLAPGTGLRTGGRALVLQQQPPRERPGTGSPWAGLSGSPVVFRDRLLGIALRDRRPGSWEHSQLDLLPVTALLADDGFRAALTEHLGELPRPEGISATEIADADFERDHARAIEADYGRIRIFGLRQAGRRGWDLTTSYLSLEIHERPGTGRNALFAQGPQRVDRMLRGRRRVLVRGQAGSGKTTLVQWLAVGAIKGTLGPELAEFNHRVPLVLQLRKLHRKGNLRPRPEEFLALDDRMCADRQPDGWAHRLLSGGRALLLVDGLDEVPDEQREEALDWLEQLLGHYPGTVTLATVRPSAVAGDRLDHLGFDDLLLCPMNDRDRRRFVERWHLAALGELLAAPHTDSEAQRWRHEIAQDQADLLRILETVPELSALTDSPLLCAMICALHRETDGALPRHRMALYRDAMSMMLVKRDEGRKVQGPEHLHATEEEQLALLRRIAHWLVRNNQAEGRRSDALTQIRRALADLPGLRGSTPEQAYTHLLNRTGLLTETGPDTFQFIHRTFQDYLAAMEFREEHDFGLLAGHAEDEQWGDVIRMTVGHCGRRERGELLTHLLDTAPDSPALALLTASCLPSAPELDGTVRTRILDRLRTHLAALLSTGTHLPRLSLVGEELLPLLRDAVDGTIDMPGPAVRIHVPDLLGLIGGSEALLVLEELAARQPSVSARQNVIAQWRHFDAKEFAQRLVLPVDLSDIQVQASSTDRIAELVGHPTLRHLWVGGNDFMVGPQLWESLPQDLRQLHLVALQGISDIAFVQRWGRLEGLSIIGCADLHDLAPLHGLGLSRLTLRAVPAEHDVDALFATLRSLPDLEEVVLQAPDLAALSDWTPLTGATDLTLHNLTTDYRLGPIAALFPSLTQLWLLLDDSGCSTLDLTPFAGFPGLSLQVLGWNQQPELIGSALFPSDRLSVRNFTRD
ncbi:NACHT domain-containing protein [Kitasatospora sp. NPDC088391]|uniref:NACHT domain-containing protein n=1 Tax=Kitasatospora sp. NPDC088391 TaxID=3364074 RepID=UPI00380880FC